MSEEIGYLHLHFIHLRHHGAMPHEIGLHLFVLVATELREKLITSCWEFNLMLVLVDAVEDGIDGLERS